MPAIIRFPTNVWAQETADVIENIIFSFLKKSGTCSVCLTGGHSASRLYGAWAQSPNFKKMSGVNFFWSDERIVSPNSSQSNYFLVKEKLFLNGVPLNCSLYPINTDQSNIERVICEYEKVLPESLDLLVLSVADDGHIASLFVDGQAIFEQKKKVVASKSATIPYERVTITQSVIKKAKNIIVLAPGLNKSKILDLAMLDPENFSSLPARLVLNGVWVLEG